MLKFSFPYIYEARRKGLRIATAPSGLRNDLNFGYAIVGDGVPTSRLVGAQAVWAPAF